VINNGTNAPTFTQVKGANVGTNVTNAAPTFSPPLEGENVGGPDNDNRKVGS